MPTQCLRGACLAWRLVGAPAGRHAVSAVRQPEPGPRRGIPPALALVASACFGCDGTDTEHNPRPCPPAQLVPDQTYVCLVCQTTRMIVRLAREQDFPGFLGLAAEVEHWFGPMVEDPGFHSAVDEHIRQSTALVAVSGSDVFGGLLFGAEPPIYHVHWLVVSEKARGQGVGRALMADATQRFVRGPGSIEVVTFGADHPGAVASGARAFYEGLDFTPAEAAAPGPEGGSRQLYRRTVTC